MNGSGKKRRKSRWKWIVAALVVVFIIGSVVASKMNSGGSTIDIATTKVTIGTIEERVTETGNIELLRTVEVKSKIAGTVKDILVKEGDQVRKDQVLCVIDPDPSQTLILFQKRSGVAQAQINLDQIRRELERRRELAKTSLVSAKELEDAESQYKIAQNTFSLASQELEIMEREIETSGSGSDERIVASKVRALWDGYITQRFVEEGTVVTSGMNSVVAGTVVFQIGDPSTKIIKTNISEVDIGKVHEGLEVRIRLDAYPDTSFTGSIRHISPVGILQSGRNVVTFKTEVEIIDEDPRLQPGMSCDVDVIVARVDSTRYLPVEAVYEKKTGTEEDRNVKMVPIIYVQKAGVIQADSTKSGSKKSTADSTSKPEKKKWGFIKEKHDPLDDYEEKVVEVGIHAETRLQILTEIDTTKVIAEDAEMLFKALESRAETAKNKKGAKVTASSAENK